MKSGVKVVSVLSEARSGAAEPAQEQPAARGSRVLFLVADDWYFVSHRLAWAQELVRRGCTVGVGCATHADASRIEEAGVQVLPIPFERHSLSPLVVLRACLAVRRAVRAFRPDLVHLVALRAILIGWMATIGLRRPAFVNAVAGLGSLFSGTTDFMDGGAARRGSTEGTKVNQEKMGTVSPSSPSLPSVRARSRLWWARQVVRALFTRVFKQPTAHTVFQNQEDLESFVRRGLCPAERAHLVRGVGVDPESWQPRPEVLEDAPVVLFVGRMLRDKGLGELLEASDLLRKRGIYHVLRLAGDVDLSNPMSYRREELYAWAQAGKVDWFGYHHDVLEQMSLAQVVALPSYREGLPKVLLEAGLAERAVVTTDVAGCREVVRDRESGLLVPPRDHVALADALELLLKNSGLRRRLAAALRERVRTEFSQMLVQKSMARVYQAALGFQNLTW